MKKVLIPFVLVLFVGFFMSCDQQEQPVREDIKTSVMSVVKFGNMYFFSGHVGNNPDRSYPEGMTAQTELLMEKYKTALSELGLTFDDIVKANVYITDIADKPAMNKVYAAYFTGKRPTRVCAVVGLEGDAIVEMAAIAVK